MKWLCKICADGCYLAGTDRQISFCRLYKPQTNADRIRAMSNEELADFLCSIAYAGNTPWSEPFETEFCKSCPTIKATIKKTGETMVLKECDFVGGVCPHGGDAVWWLRQPAKDGDGE